MLRDGTVEHAADRNPVDRSALHAEADTATREDVDYDHNPVTAKEDGFAAEQVNTPQAVLGLGEKRQPGWAISSSGPRPLMFGEDAAHHVLVLICWAIADGRNSGFWISSRRLPRSVRPLGPLARACDGIGRTRTVAGI